MCYGEPAVTSVGKSRVDAKRKVTDRGRVYHAVYMRSRRDVDRRQRLRSVGRSSNLKDAHSGRTRHRAADTQSANEPGEERIGADGGIRIHDTRPPVRCDQAALHPERANVELDEPGTQNSELRT